MKKNNKAFSLVEILVALIIVSLITAALVPVITKKLSSSGITISGGGGGGVPSAGACALVNILIWMNKSVNIALKDTSVMALIS